MSMIRFLSAYLICSVFTVPSFGAICCAADKFTVFVSIVPQKYFVEQIARDLVEVHVMVQPGASPATYEPKPQQMVDLSKSKIYFAIGVPFEKAWLGKIASSNPKMKVVQTDHGIQKRRMAADKHHAGDKSQEKPGHDHEVLDPHVWLSPPQVMIQARNILSALQEADPTRKALYEANYKEFVSRLTDLDVELRAMLAEQRGLLFMVFHPAWGYFADTYGLTQIPIEIDGKDPKPAQLQNLIQTARAKEIKVIFLQPQFPTRSAEQVAKEIGGQVALVDPLALNWAENLREMARKLKAAAR